MVECQQRDHERTVRLVGQRQRRLLGRQRGPSETGANRRGRMTAFDSTGDSRRRTARAGVSDQEIARHVSGRCAQWTLVSPRVVLVSLATALGLRNAWLSNLAANPKGASTMAPWMGHRRSTPEGNARVARVVHESGNPGV